MFDSYIYMEIGLPMGLDGELYHDKVKSHAVDRYGIPAGVETSNPINDTRLYDLEVLAADVDNVFLTTPCRDKVWKRAGPEFVIREGKVLIFKQALYVIKYYGATFYALLSENEMILDSRSG